MSQNFFTQAIGGYVRRGTNRIFVKDYNMAMALFKLQDDTYKFTPDVVIHNRLQECESCSA